MLGARAREMTSAKKNSNDVQVRHFVKAVPVQFKPVLRKTHEEVRVAVSKVYGLSSGLPDLSDDVSIG